MLFRIIVIRISILPSVITLEAMVAQVMLLLFDMLDQKGEPSLHVVYQAIIQSKIIYALPDALRESAGSAIPTSSIPVHPPTIEEVDKAISRLRSRRAPGICGIHQSYSRPVASAAVSG